MNTEHRTLEAFLDRAIAALRGETPEPTEAEQAAARVWQRLADEMVATKTVGAGGDVRQIRSCDDYQALIPAYLAGELTEARALLLEDHTRECISCRRALKAAKSGKRAPASAPGGARGYDAAARRIGPAAHGERRRPVWLAAAAGLLLAVGAALVFLIGDFSNRSDLAQVAAVDGSLYRVVDGAAVAMTAGETVSEGEELRTARGASAVLRLEDGSQVEVRERSALTLADRRGDVTIQVARGSIIVDAAEQRGGHLYASTDECLVAVTGTVFTVNHGTKGSRISVLEGEVRVEQGRREEVLNPGDQLATRPGIGKVPLADEVSWSRDPERYMALISEIEALRQEFSRAMSATGLRYESRLLDLAPAETAVYITLPNVSGEIAGLHRFFQERLASNPLLARWWNAQVGDSGVEEQVAEMVERIGELGSHLDEEIVVTLSMGASGDPRDPLLMAGITEPEGFAALLASEVERLNAEAGAEQLVLVDDPRTAAGGPERLYLWHDGALFAAAATPERLAGLAERAAAPGGGPFVGRPFHRRLARSYGHGVQWLAGFDLAGIVAGRGQELGDQEAMRFSGLADLETLIIERQGETDSEIVHHGAQLSFSGPRRGAASWLAAPSPMGSLDFVSVDATLAAAFVVEDPRSILEQTFRFIEGVDPDFQAQIQALERAYGVNILDDIVGPLGGEVAFALDGPALPKPAWKVVAEVYDPAGMERALEWTVDRLGNTVVIDGQPIARVEQETVGGRTYNRFIAGELFEMTYTFEGGYLIAAPTRALVDRALQVYSSRYSLPDSQRFQELLPSDDYVNFSALFYADLGGIGEAVEGASDALGLPQEQRDAIAGLELGGASLTCAYGESDSIRIVTSSQGGGLFASRLGALLGLADLPQVPSGR